MSYAAPTKTVQNVIDYVVRIFGDESGVQLSTTDIIRWINEAQQEINRQNAVLQQVATTTLNADQADYDLSGISPPIYEINSLLINGRRIGNISVSQAEESISLADPESEETGAPQFWYEWAHQISFWPVPSTAGTIKIRYTAIPDNIAAGNDVLSLADEYFMDIINYVLKMAYEMDENPEMMQMKAGEFSQSLAERGEQNRNAQHMTYPTMTVYELF
jgi:hypothetical protein